MGDREVRDLERALAAEPSPAARVRLALALERCGRADEIPDVLFPVRDDARAGEVLARLPAWAYPGGDARGSRTLDVRPLDGNPTVAWVEDVPMAVRPAFLLASALGVVVGGEGGYAIVHDRSGRVRLHVAGGEALALEGPVLVAREKGSLVRRAIGSGKRLGVEARAPASGARAADWPRAVARGVAFDQRGEKTLWSLAPAALERARVLDLALLPGRVLGLTTAARIFCLVDGRPAANTRSL